MRKERAYVAGHSGARGLGSWFRSVTVPAGDGLPRMRVLLAFPALLLLAGIVLVAFDVSGTSSGVFHSQIAYGKDPALVLGTPQATRSDEWNVQTVWAIAAVQQGLPTINESFPGGMDTTLPQDLPRIDWTVAFRPHLWGFMLLDIGRAIAFKWWLPGLALAAAAYVFLVTVLPRRPIVAGLLAVGFLFSPFFQWWYLTTTLYPAVWALTTMTALVWAFKRDSRRSRWAWAAVVAYITVMMATGIYVPFIVPAVLVVIFFAVGLLLEQRGLGNRWRSTLAKTVPVLSAGVAASAVTGVWLLTKITTVEAFLGTAYPGHRSTPTGGNDVLSFVSAIGSSFTQALNAQRPGMLGPNSSEASTFFYIGIFLIPVVGWIVVRQARRRQPLPWVLLGLTGVVLLLLAYMYIPGWDALARILLLDLTTGTRVRIGMGLASLGLLAYTIRYLDDHAVRASRWVVGLSAGLFALSQAAIGYVAVRNLPMMIQAVQLWWLWALISAAAIYLAGRRRPLLAAIAFFIVTVAGSGLTNPLYRGVLDLRETAVSHGVILTNGAAPKTWVGVGGGLTTAVLLESGVRAYNGFQGAPSRIVWDAIDPGGAFAEQWNRLAGVNWKAGAGEPTVSNPAADQIMVTFDACSSFAQANVGYVLADDHSLDLSCLRPIDSFDLPKASLTIYEVVARR